MYLRAIHAEPSLTALCEFLHSHPLGTLTTFIPSPNYPSLQQTHIPWVLDEHPSTISPTNHPTTDTTTNSQPQPLGTLRGHLARANPHAKALIEAVSSNSNSTSGIIAEDVTVLFTLPSSHYITPHYYTSTKPDTGKVVPTYNYAAVQAYGRLKVYHDAKSFEAGEFLQRQIEDLTRESEVRAGYGTASATDTASSAPAHLMSKGKEGKGRAWEVSDAPTSYIDLLKQSILGIEVEITSLQGKWKMSQESSEGDREGVVKGLKEVGTEMAREIGRLVGERHEIKVAEKKVKAGG